MQTVVLDGPDDEQMGWEAVARAGEASREVIGVLDSQIESPGWDLVIVASTDSGRTWARRATLRKVYYMATVESLIARSPDHFDLVLRLDDDYGAGVAPGRYVASTEDRGSSWSPFVIAR
ncbi:hypothetical protein [Polyangium sp. 15x6]|uniref:hypothetical protein n=1 Tax=Polyangium sp. 15x6 TaxID=3042687 RepID=UPI00249B9A36|nr:hypothetical protein [Polyangium sp. 15x6]MDI3288098.1 hypothetical protein [Polyangium sp. 15x6]